MSPSFSQWRLLSLLTVLLISLAAVSAVAEIPRLISYQGRLLDDSGTPLEGTHNLVVTIYADTTASDKLWQEEHIDVAFTNGLFVVMLGSKESLNDEVYKGDLRGMTVSVDGGPETQSAIPLLSTLFTFHSLIADTASLSLTVVNNSIDSTDIKSGGVSFSDIGANGATDGQVMKYSSGTGWVAASDDGGSGAGGWTDLGSAVTLTNIGDFVGIGTNTPLGRLHIDVGASDQPALMLQDGTRDICWQTGEHLQIGEFNGTTFIERARFENNGRMGLGTADPLGMFHVRGDSLGVTSDEIGFDQLLVEDQDACLGLYSLPSGNAGSALSFAEMAADGSLVDKWGFARETTGGGSGLRLTFGDSPHPFDNSTKMIFESNGHVGLGTTSTADAQLTVSSNENYGIISNAYIMWGGDTCVGLYATAGVGFPGYPIGVIARASTGTGLLGIGDNDGGHGVIGQGFVGVRGEADEELNSVGVEGEAAATFESIGVHGLANTGNSTTEGVRGESFVSSSIGVHGMAAGSSGRGILGEATHDGSTSQNVGGTFTAAGGYGKAVRAEATGAHSTAVSAISTGTYGTGLFAKGGSSGVAAHFQGNIEIFAYTGATKVLELGEGLDYAEGFDVSADDITPGTVLIIDPDHPGQLTRSRKAYDSRVAGIVAGANNLGSGVRLGADQYDHDVALAGRVYCYVEAGPSGIEPGDLLTTSDRPGFAMKAQDYLKAQGAILGKAMERMEPGAQGLILVLVTLQ